MHVHGQLRSGDLSDHDSKRTFVWDVDVAIRIVLLLILLLGALPISGRLDITSAIDSSKIVPLGGNAYGFPDVSNSLHVPADERYLYFAASDTMATPQASMLQVLEDGHPIGPAHSLHSEIEAKGSGRFSYWDGSLRFSASDNSDPRSSGRRYSIVVQPTFWRLLSLPVCLLLVLVIARAIAGLSIPSAEIRAIRHILKSKLLWRSICLLCVIYTGAYYVFAGPPLPIITPDSFSYWAGESSRSLGYPGFMAVLASLSSSLRSVETAQIIVFCAAVVAVLFGLERVTGSSFIACMASVTVLTLGESAPSALIMLTESLLLSMILFHVAAAACVLAKPTRLNLLMLALTAMLAVSIRPAGYFLFGGIVFLTMFLRQHRRLALVWGVVPMILLTLGLYGLGELVRGQADQEIAGAALFPHVVHLFDKAPSSVDARLVGAINSPLIKPYQEARLKASDWDEIQNLEANAFNAILNDILRRLRDDGKLNRREADQLLLKLSLFTIEAHSLGYLETVAQNMYAWYNVYMFLNEPAVGSRLEAEIEYHWPEMQHFAQVEKKKWPLSEKADFERETYLAKDSSFAPSIDVPQSWRGASRLAFLIVTGVTVTAFLLGRGGPAIAFVSYVSMLAVGGALLVCLSTVFILRYEVPLEPLVTLSIVLGSSLALRAGFGLVALWAGSRPRRD